MNICLRLMKLLSYFPPFLCSGFQHVVVLCCCFFFLLSVIFHVATLMPTRDSDPGCNSKKMHIGNDFVTIVYNDSQQTVKFGRIKVRLRTQGVNSDMTLSSKGRIFNKNSQLPHYYLIVISSIYCGGNACRFYSSLGEHSGNRNLKAYFSVNVLN